MTRIATSPFLSVRARLLACAALCLGAAGCAPPGMPRTSVPQQNLAYPSFGAPAQIGTRPVMDPATQAKTQASLESLARNRAGEMQQQIDQGGDMKPGQ